MLASSKSHEANWRYRRKFRWERTTGDGGLSRMDDGGHRTGADISEAQTAAYRLAAQVAIPNARYRNDIGTKLMAHGFSFLQRLGLLDGPESDAKLEHDGGS